MDSGLTPVQSGPIKLSDLDRVRVESGMWKLLAKKEKAEKLAHEVEAAERALAEAQRDVQETDHDFEILLTGLGIDVTRRFKMNDENEVVYLAPPKQVKS